MKFKLTGFDDVIEEEQESFGDGLKVMLMEVLLEGVEDKVDETGVLICLGVMLDYFSDGCLVILVDFTFLSEVVLDGNGQHHLLFGSRHYN